MEAAAEEVAEVTVGGPAAEGAIAGREFVAGLVDRALLEAAGCVAAILDCDLVRRGIDVPCRSAPRRARVVRGK